MGILQEADWGTFKRKETWQAFGIAVVLFVTISFAALSMFDSMEEIFQSNAEPEPIPNIIIESLNRTGIESPIVNETGWIETDSLRGSVLIIDFMAHDCSNCHAVQAHLEEKVYSPSTDSFTNWSDLAKENGVGFHVIAYGAWYSEDLDYLNETSGAYHPPYYPTGIGSEDSGTLENGSTVDPVRLFTTGGTGQIPVVMIVDEDGFMIERQSSGTPTDGWKQFDSRIESALQGEAKESWRMGWEVPETNMSAILLLGMVLSILVYFSPCAFPVLPGFISYYLSLNARQDEMMEEGKLKSEMPSPFVIGALSGFGMLTFFAIIGAVAAVMGEAFSKSGLIHYIAIAIAILLVVLGGMMLIGVTSHLMGFVQSFVDKYSTTEADETFTPRRNMYLYGFGYAAASIDCTAAAVLPFVIYLGTLGGDAVFMGILGLMIGLLILMVAVVMLVAAGRQVMINFLRRATGMIKMVGSWMMMMAGIFLTIYLTNQDVVGAIFG